jgi:hypothetical protein
MFSTCHTQTVNGRMGDYVQFERRKCKKKKIQLACVKINSEPVQKNQTYSNIHLNFKHNFILSMFGIRIETKILFSLNN